MKTVLIIEDNSDILENTTELLQLAGFNVICVDNGRKGIAVAKEKKPDIILCDILMPEVNGYQVITELKQDPETASIAFIYVTASGEKNEVKVAMDMGANGYVRKPYDVKELMDAINRCITG